MGYADGELAEKVADLESNLVERKQTFDGDAPNTVREAICAFANDLADHRKPGVVFVGADDDGKASGLEVNDALLLNLARCKTDGNIVPPPTMSVTRHRLAGGDVAVVTVTPSDSPPVRYRGRIWVRVGPRRALASAQDERILTEKRRHGDAPFDARPVRGATLDDLDLARFQYLYLPRAFDEEVLVRRSTYAPDALREFMRNAVMHRAYEATNSPVHLSWFDDRVEIVSPGGPFGDVKAGSFGEPGVIGYRNPNLAEAMRVTGLVQRFGVGIPMARRALRYNNQPPPGFEVDTGRVRCTVRVRPDWPGNV